MNGVVSKVKKEIYFSLYTGKMYTVSSGNCPSFACATSSSLFMLTAGPRGQFTRWRRMLHAWCVFSKLCTKLTLHCNHKSGHLKTEHTESLSLLRRHLLNWPLSPAVSTSERTAGSACETWTVAAADGVRFAPVRWEINFLLPFETAPFICKHPVLLKQIKFRF